MRTKNIHTHAHKETLIHTRKDTQTHTRTQRYKDTHTRTQRFKYTHTNTFTGAYSFSVCSCVCVCVASAVFRALCVEHICGRRRTRYYQALSIAQKTLLIFSTFHKRKVHYCNLMLPGCSSSVMNGCRSRHTRPSCSLVIHNALFKICFMREMLFFTYRETGKTERHCDRML